MCGWLKHFIERHNNGHFNYVGMDIWKEALEVAVEFDPYIRVEQGSILTDKPPLPLGEGFSDKYSYTWCSNIQFGKDAPKVIENMMAVTERFAFFGMPDYCGDYEEMAKGLGYMAESIYCGEAHGSKQYLVKVWQ